MNRGFWRSTIPPAATFVALMVAAEVFVRLKFESYYLVSPPSLVLAAMWKYRALFAQRTLQTACGACAGLGLSILAGVVIGVLLSSSRWVRRAFYPYAVFFQTVPIIAIAPLLVIWLDNGMKTVIASAFIVSLFPVIANTLAGLEGTDPALRDLFRLYKAGPLTTLWKLRLPSALPSIITGFRIASGLAVIGAIVGEFIVPSGLGTAIQVSSAYGNTDQTFAAILLATLLGLALFGVINLVGYILLRHWHASARS